MNHTIQSWRPSSGTYAWSEAQPPGKSTPYQIHQILLANTPGGQWTPDKYIWYQIHQTLLANTTDTAFSHHYQGSINCNTANIHNTNQIGMLYILCSLTDTMDDIESFDLQRLYFPIYSTICSLGSVLTYTLPRDLFSNICLRTVFHSQISETQPLTVNIDSAQAMRQMGTKKNIHRQGNGIKLRLNWCDFG